MRNEEALGSLGLVWKSLRWVGLGQPHEKGSRQGQSMAVTEHRTLEAGRKVASLTCLLSPSEQGESPKDRWKPDEHFCRQLLCSHGSSVDASTNVSAERQAPRSLGPQSWLCQI